MLFQNVLNGPTTIRLVDSYGGLFRQNLWKPWSTFWFSPSRKKVL